jgi:hypothetical protein
MKLLVARSVRVWFGRLTDLNPRSADELFPDIGLKSLVRGNSYLDSIRLGTLAWAVHWWRVLSQRWRNHLVFGFRHRR